MAVGTVLGLAEAVGAAVLALSSARAWEEAMSEHASGSKEGM
jgi:hypothetical protein